MLRSARLFGVLMLFLLASALPVAGADAAATRAQFGVNGGGLLDLPAQQRDAHLAAISRARLDAVRVDASWVAVEPSAPDAATGAHAYEWAKYDEWVAALARNNLRWYPMIGYSAPWSSSDGRDVMAPPADPAQYATFAGAVAARYGSRGTFWAEHPELPKSPVTQYEIWNEPNFDVFWRPQANAPEVYADLYLAAREAIKAADPSGQAVTAGLLDASAGDVHDFLRRMVRHRVELRTKVDAVGYHPYQQDYDAVMAGITEFRRTMSLVGLGNVGLEITEIGMSTAYVPEATRASSMARLARELPESKLKVTRFMPYNWLLSKEAETAPNPQDMHQWWGMVRSDTSPTPTATAYAAAVGQALSAKPAVKKRVLKKSTKKKSAKKAKRMKFSARSRATAKQRRTLEARASSALAF